MTDISFKSEGEGDCKSTEINLIPWTQIHRKFQDGGTCFCPLSILSFTCQKCSPGRRQYQKIDSLNQIVMLNQRLWLLSDQTS